MYILKQISVLLVLVGVSYPVNTETIRPDGMGPIRIGMSLAELNTVLHENFSLPIDKEEQRCFHVNPKGYPVDLMIESGRLVRVEVTVPGIVTAQGVQVGDAEVHTQRIYGRRLKVEPSAYSGDEGGRYLTVRSRDGRYGLRFVTEKGKIVTLYGGTYTAIQYVEGCE